MIDDGDIIGTGCENKSGSLTPLENFDYSNKKIGCLIQWNIQKTNFSGLTVSYINKIHLALLQFNVHFCQH